MLRRPLAILLLLTGAALGACSDDGDGSSAASYSVAASLRQIPVGAIQDGSILAMSGDSIGRRSSPEWPVRGATQTPTMPSRGPSPTGARRATWRSCRSTCSACSGP
jgi:hypothetical protein